MIPGIILFFVVAITDWVAVARGWKRVEYFAKPLAMVVLLGLVDDIGAISPRAKFLGQALTAAAMTTTSRPKA